MLRPIPPRLLSVVIALAAWGCASGAAQAQSVPAHDAVVQLLAERGLLHAPESDTRSVVIDSAASIGRQVRDTTSGLVLSAMTLLGVPYKRGGNSSEDGFDCSGFTRHVYESTLGLLLPRKVDDQAKADGFSAVKKSELRPGDLVFFNTLRRTFSHVGIYIGEGKFIHAPRSGSEVRVESMGVKYWAKRFTGARRADALQQTPAQDLDASATPSHTSLSISNSVSP